MKRGNLTLSNNNSSSFSLKKINYFLSKYIVNSFYVSTCMYKIQFLNTKVNITFFTNAQTTALLIRFNIHFRIFVEAFFRVDP